MNCNTKGVFYGSKIGYDRSADREDAVLDYMARMAKVNEQVKDKIVIIPRIYTNKPRTTGLFFFIITGLFAGMRVPSTVVPFLLWSMI